MGWNYRKSINLGGGFRVNISKSGIGYSWGVPGYRVTRTARGNIRRTASIPRTGISYTQETSRSSNRSQRNPINEEIIETQSRNIISNAHLDDICKALNKTLFYNYISTWIIIVGIIFGFVNPFIFIVGAIGIILKAYVIKYGAINIDYKVEPEEEKKYRGRLKFWDTIFQAEHTWQTLSEQGNNNKKNNFGVAKSIKRKIVEKSGSYRFIKSNMEYITIRLNKEFLVVLPDKLFVKQKRKFRAVDYNELIIDSHYMSFVESQKVPSDAQVIKMVWEHSNRDGSRDKRFSNNRQLPLCKYIEVKIESASGLLIKLLISNTNSPVIEMKM